MDTRIATPADLRGIMLVWQAAYAERVKVTTIAPKIAAEDYIVLIAETPAGITGFAIVFLSPKPDRARLDWIAVHPADALPGTGTALLCGIERAAVARGATCLNLAVRRANTRAIRFYERAGYARTDERPAGFSYAKTLPTGG